MGKEEECEKIRRILSFSSDKAKLDKAVAIANRLLKWNEDGSPCVYSESERAITPECIVHGLIAEALYGTRKWNMEEMPDFEGWIITQLKSKKFNLVRKLIRPLPSKRNKEDEEADISPDDTAIRPIVSLEREIEENGFNPRSNDDYVRDYEDEEFVNVLKHRLEDRVIDYFVLEEVLDKKNNQEIASNLKMEISEVENAIKRIKRVIDKLLRERSNDRSEQSYGIDE